MLAEITAVYDLYLMLIKAKTCNHRQVRKNYRAHKRFAADGEGFKATSGRRSLFAIDRNWSTLSN